MEICLGYRNYFGLFGCNKHIIYSYEIRTENSTIHFFDWFTVGPSFRNVGNSCWRLGLFIGEYCRYGACVVISIMGKRGTFLLFVNSWFSERTIKVER